jgi:hypothetical protein
MIWIADFPRPPVRILQSISSTPWALPMAIEFIPFGDEFTPDLSKDFFGSTQLRRKDAYEIRAH